MCIENDVQLLLNQEEQLKEIDCEILPHIHEEDNQNARNPLLLEGMRLQRRLINYR